MSYQSITDQLNPKQHTAATTGNKHTLVLAGAGCGKTKTIVARAAHLIHQGVQPSRILIITFTRKAASELINRVEQALGDLAFGLQASTFHTWCMTLIRRSPKSFGLSEELSVIDRDDQETLIKLSRGAIVTSEGKIPPAPGILSFYSFARNTGKSFTEALEVKYPRESSNIDFVAQMKLIVKDYENRKLQRRYIDYDDILEIVARSLEDHSEIRQWIGGAYDHILVDEMQDTNPLQWRLLDPLSNVSTLYCVGDARQSIYKFRGADFQNVNRFSERLPDSQTLYLSDNYRSTQELLDISNWLMSKSEVNYGESLRAFRGAGNKPQLLSFEDQMREASWIASKIADKRADGENYANNLILTRSAYSSRAMEAALLAREIPYMFLGGHKLLKSAHIRDVLSLVRLIGNFKDEIAWMRFLCLFPGIGDRGAQKITQDILGNQSFEELLFGLNAIPKIPFELIDALENTYRLRDDVLSCYKKAVEKLFFVLANSYKNQNWENRVKDFSMVEQLASKHDTLLGFIEEYVLNPLSESDLNSGGPKDIVTLSTIHSSKGMEAPRVFVLNVSPLTFPMPMACDDPEEIEEERRTLYVALTRAQDELYVCRTLTTFSNSSVTSPNSGAQYFLNDLPSDMVEESIVGYGGLQADNAAPVISVRPSVGMRFDD